MAKFKAEIYVLEHIWERRDVEVEAKSEEEAIQLIESFDDSVDVSYSEGAELENTNQDIEIYKIARTTDED